MPNKHTGSSFDDFLRDEGTYEEVTATAVKRVLAWQLAEAMRVQQISRAEMARRMKTSRSQIGRLLDPDNDTAQLDTLQKAAAVVGKRLTIVLEDIPR